jgi:hypothetical protein
MPQKVKKKNCLIASDKLRKYKYVVVCETCCLKNSMQKSNMNKRNILVQTASGSRSKLETSRIKNKSAGHNIVMFGP